MAGKAVTVTEVPLGWLGSRGSLVPLALLALPGTASQPPAGCRRDREQGRTWKGPESANVCQHQFTSCTDSWGQNNEWRGNEDTDQHFNQGFSKVFLTQWLLYILPKGVLSNTSWNNGAYRNTQVLPSAFSFWGKIKGTYLFLFLFLILLNKAFLWFFLLPYLIPMYDVQWNNIFSHQIKKDSFIYCSCSYSFIVIK